jgi:hypothetical protein
MPTAFRDSLTDGFEDRGQEFVARRNRDGRLWTGLLLVLVEDGAQTWVGRALLGQVWWEHAAADYVESALTGPWPSVASLAGWWRPAP